jgi:hypothetical protein
MRKLMDLWLQASHEPRLTLLLGRIRRLALRRGAVMSESTAVETVVEL